MQNVTINSKKYGVDIDTPIKLTNGSLVLHYNKDEEIFGAYLVTSFRDQKGTLRNCEHTSNYCSLVNLDNGYLKFEERCSRNTTVGRVLAHLTRCNDGGKEAIRMGHYIEIYPTGKFKIDLSFDKEDKMKCL